MAITAKPAAGTYTVNTGHAKCPTHLWLCDEGSGTNLNDQGAGTPYDMTLQNADMWGTDGALGAIITCNSSPGRYALGVTGFDADTSLLLVAIVKSASTVCAAAENILQASSTTAGTARGGISFTTAEVAQAFWDDGSGTGAKAHSDVSYDATWRMVAGKFTTNAKGISIDGGAWQLGAGTYDFPFTGAFGAPTRYGLGIRPNNTPASPLNGNILAGYAYEDQTYSTWDDAWISALYDDPWQFLVVGGLVSPLQGKLGGLLAGKL